MTYARTGRHYHTAKREKTPDIGVFYPNIKKTSAAAIACVFGTIFFWFGFIMGVLMKMLFGNKKAV